MQARLELLKEKKLIGKRKKMSYKDNTTFELWQSFMPKLKDISNKTGTDLFSVEVYNNPDFFIRFDPGAEFEKWAAIEVNDYSALPPEMETLLLPAGLYAVFEHKGPASEGFKTYEYIFKKWIPGSDFVLDNRPHFALMGEKYKHNDINSEEEIWIPVKPK